MPLVGRIFNPSRMGVRGGLQIRPTRRPLSSGIRRRVNRPAQWSRPGCGKGGEAELRGQDVPKLELGNKSRKKGPVGWDQRSAGPPEGCFVGQGVYHRLAVGRRCIAHP